MNEIYSKTKKVKFYLKNKKQGWASIVEKTVKLTTHRPV
jgi:hypothetical protein